LDAEGQRFIPGWQWSHMVRTAAATLQAFSSFTSEEAANVPGHAQEELKIALGYVEGHLQNCLAEPLVRRSGTIRNFVQGPGYEDDLPHLLGSARFVTTHMLGIKEGGETGIDAMVVSSMQKHAKWKIPPSEHKKIYSSRLSGNKATASSKEGSMFAILLMTQLDAAEGYTSIYGDGSSQALAGIKIPSVPWGRCDTLGTCPHLEKVLIHTLTHTPWKHARTRTKTHTPWKSAQTHTHTHTHTHTAMRPTMGTPLPPTPHGTMAHPVPALAHAHTPAARAAHDEGQREASIGCWRQILTRPLFPRSFPFLSALPAPPHRYLVTSNPLALDGGAATGHVVDARHSRDCADNFQGFGCRNNGSLGGATVRSY
jgi:hypothetical protein